MFASPARASVSLLITALAFWAVAQEKTDDKTLSPYFVVENQDGSVEGFPLKSTDVRASITGMIANVTVTQTYTNTGASPIHAQYVFPASTRAAVHGLVMTIGNRRIQARVKEKQAAKQEYEIAKNEGKSATLLEQNRPNVFTMNLANILPGDVVKVELQYTEFLECEDDIYEFVYPTVVGPRYSNVPASSASDNDKWVVSPYRRKNKESPATLSITAIVSSPVAIEGLQCTTHATAVKWEAPTLATVTLDPPDKAGGNRDFIVQFRLKGKSIGSGVLLYEGEDENFFLVTTQPPERVSVNDIPGREYIFVVDVSGSMEGFPLNTSKLLVKNLVANLRSTDLFNVILFAGSSQAMADRSLPPTEANVNKAIRMIDQQNGGGGTELLPALNRAVSLPRDERFSRSVVVITDGYISAEAEAFSFIRKNLDRTNFFAFGIGSSVNRHLIEGIAKAGQGERFVVTEPGEANRVAEKLRVYLSSPVLTNISIEYDGFDAYDVEPAQVPDLMAQRPLVVFGKYRGRARGSIIVTGTGGQGKFTAKIAVNSLSARPENETLKYLWARTRIAALDDYNPDVNNDERVRQVTSLGLTYNLLTQYTSFIAVHDIVRNVGGYGNDVAQPLALPQGVSELAVGGGMNKVPEPGLLILALPFAWYLFSRKRKSLVHRITRSLVAESADHHRE